MSSLMTSLKLLPTNISPDKFWLNLLQLHRDLFLDKEIDTNGNTTGARKHHVGNIGVDSGNRTRRTRVDIRDELPNLPENIQVMKVI